MKAVYINTCFNLGQELAKTALEENGVVIYVAITNAGGGVSKTCVVPLAGRQASYHDLVTDAVDRIARALEQASLQHSITPANEN